MTEPRGTSGAAAPLDREALESFWLEPVWEQAAHQLAQAPHVIDVRNIGLLAAIDLKPREGAPGARAAECAHRCFEEGVLIRNSADTLVLSPPLIISESEIELVFATIRRAIGA